MVKELREELADEKRRNSSLRLEITRLKKLHVTTSAATEAEEEAIVNALARRFLELKREKEELVMQVEAEEELLTNTLQKRLSGVRREKVELQERLEAEQEFIVNKLQRQLQDVEAERQALTQGLHEDTSSLLNRMQLSLRKLRRTMSVESEEAASSRLDEGEQLLRSVEDEVEQLTTRLAELAPPPPGVDPLAESGGGAQAPSLLSVLQLQHASLGARISVLQQQEATAAAAAAAAADDSAAD